MNEVSKNNVVVVTKVGDFWVNKDRAANIMKIKSADPNGVIDIDGDMIAAHTIEAALSPKTYSELQKKRRGCYYCEYGHWHERGTSCAHGREMKMLSRS